MLTKQTFLLSPRSLRRKLIRGWLKLHGARRSPYLSATDVIRWTRLNREAFVEQLPGDGKEAP